MAFVLSKAAISEFVHHCWIVLIDLSNQRSVADIGEPSDGHAYGQGDDENMFCDKKWWIG